MYVVLGQVYHEGELNAILFHARFDAMRYSRSTHFQNASRWLCAQRLRRRPPGLTRRGRFAFGFAQLAVETTEISARYPSAGERRPRLELHEQQASGVLAPLLRLRSYEMPATTGRCRRGDDQDVAEVREIVVVEIPEVIDAGRQRERLRITLLVDRRVDAPR